jgi:hypothetical protein
MTNQVRQPYEYNAAPLPNEPLPLRPRRRRRRGRALVIVVVALALGSAGVWALTHRQYIADQLTVWNFHTSSTIDGYITRSTMTGEGEFLFLASQPEVSTAAKFNDVCANHEEGSGVLGCYLPTPKTITLFDVTDPRLDGIEEVVASHEMLHAAWDRMSEQQRNDLAPLLEAAFAQQSENKDLTARMEFYERNEPGERLNELHSILGTEVAKLSPALEKYYSSYFSDRQALVALHVKSNAVFVDLEAKSAALVSELDALKTSIETDYASYNAGYDALNQDVNAFNTKAKSGGFSSQSEYNSQRNALLTRQAALDARFASIQARETTYEEKVKELQSLNALAVDLNTSLNIVPRTSDGVDK